MPSRDRGIYSSNAWRKARMIVLERDQWLCQIRGPRCTEIATQVDHIVPVLQGGSKFDPLNLRASCQKCNYSRIDRKRDESWRNGPTHITLVMGPPAAGKSTYVREHARAGDLIVDYDAIALSLGADPHAFGQTMHPVINAARNAMLRQLRAGTTGAERAWVLSANPEADRRFPYHAIVMVDPGLEQTMLNARAARRPRDYLDAIRAWYATRAPSDGPDSSREW